MLTIGDISDAIDRLKELEIEKDEIQANLNNSNRRHPDICEPMESRLSTIQSEINHIYATPVSAETV